MLTYMRAHCTGITGPIVSTVYIACIANAVAPGVNTRESAHRAHAFAVPFVVSTYLVAYIAIAVRPCGMVTYKIALVTNAVGPVMLTGSTAYGAHMIVIPGMIGAYKLAICANGIIPDVTRTYGVAAILAYAVHPVMGIGDECTFLLHRY